MKGALSCYSTCTFWHNECSFKISVITIWISFYIMRQERYNVWQKIEHVKDKPRHRETSVVRQGLSNLNTGFSNQLWCEYQYMCMLIFVFCTLPCLAAQVSFTSYVLCKTYRLKDIFCILDRIDPTVDSCFELYGSHQN